MEIAKKSIRGTLILSIGNLAYTAVSAAAIILIARFLGPSGYGVYTLSLVIPGVFLNFIDFGVYTAAVRYAAYYNSIGKPDEARRYTTNAIRFLWMAGAAFTVINFVLAGTLSALLLHRPELTPYVQLMSLSILANAILLTATWTAVGWTWMSLSTATQVVQAALRLVLSPLLIVAGLSVVGALIGHVVSFFVAGLLGTFLLYMHRLRGPKGSIDSLISDTKEMLRFGLPVYAGTMISGLTLYYVTIILAVIASNATFGFYQAANNFISPVSSVSLALVNALLPAFASVHGVGGDVQEAFRHAYKFVAFLLTPAIFFLIASSNYLVQLLYGSSFLGSIPYLQLLALANLPVAFGFTAHSAFFNGFKRTRLTMVMNLSGALVLAVSAPLLSIVLNLGVFGLIYSLFLSYLLAWITGTVLAHKYMGATMDFRANGAILAISAISYAVTVIVPKILSSDVLTLLVYLLVFFGVYLTLAPLSRVVNESDILTVEETFGELSFIGRFVSPVLRYERLLMGLSKRNRA